MDEVAAPLRAASAIALELQFNCLPSGPCSPHRDASALFLRSGVDGGAAAVDLSIHSNAVGMDGSRATRVRRLADCELFVFDALRVSGQGSVIEMVS